MRFLIILFPYTWGSCGLSPQLEAIDQTPFDRSYIQKISVSLCYPGSSLHPNPCKCGLYQMNIIPDYIPLFIALKQSTLRPRSSFLGTSIRPTSKICNQNIINTSPFSLWGPYTLEHYSTTINDTHLSIFRLYFGKYDHLAVLPTYTQKLKQLDPVQKVLV